MKKLIAVWLAVLLTATVVNAFNLSPYTFKLRSKLTSADSVSIYGGSLHAEHVDSVIVVTMRASDKVITDTIYGATDIVGIIDDTLRLDIDSTGAYAIMTFGGFGGGIRWDESADEMQYTNDFVTWTAIGSGGSSSTNADSLDGAVAHVRPLTDGYYLRYAATGDSLYLSGVTGSTDEDSQFVSHQSSRWRPLPDSTPQYMGETTASLQMDFSRADTILAFIGIYYGEGVADSMLMSKAWIEGIVGDSVAGKLDGINSENGISGGASQGTATLQLDPAHFYVVDDTANIYSWNGGNVTINSVGSNDHTEIDVRENAVLFWEAYRRANAPDSNYTTAKYAKTLIGDSIAQHWAAFIADANVNVFDSLYKYMDTINVLSASDELFAWLDTCDAIIERATLADSTNGGAIRAEIAKTVVDAWLYGYIDTSSAKIPTATLADTTVGGAARAMTSVFSDSTAKTTHGSIELWDLATACVDSTKIVDGGVGYADLGVGAVNKIKATVVDSATGALRASLLIAPEGSANTAGHLTADSIVVDTLFATLGNFTNLKIGTDVFITDITGTGLAMSGSSLTTTLGTAITSSEITDGEVALGDMASNSIDSTKIVDGGIGSGDIGTGRITTTHVLDNTLAAADIATGGVATAEILDGTITGNDIDTTTIIRADELRANWLIPWPDSVLGLGSGAGLTISSDITLGTDITDDSIVVDYYPEYEDAVLANLIMPTWQDSIDIYGYIDTVAGMGNTMYFNDSTLTSGLHRRGLQLTIKHPMRVDSLRYIIVQGLVKDSSATNTMWLKGMLRTSTFRAANLDSNAASTIKDYDSLGGDYTDVASVRQFVLSGGAITEGSPWYLMLIARHGSGTAWNWAQSGRIRAVYTRNRL